MLIIWVRQRVWFVRRFANCLVKICRVVSLIFFDRALSNWTTFTGSPYQRVTGETQTFGHSPVEWVLRLLPTLDGGKWAFWAAGENARFPVVCRKRASECAYAPSLFARSELLNLKKSKLENRKTQFATDNTERLSNTRRHCDQS